MAPSKDELEFKIALGSAWTTYGYLESKNPKSLKIAVLVNKKGRRKADVDIDYTCFNIDNKYVVGYGFDVDEYGRNIPFIGSMREE